MLRFAVLFGLGVLGLHRLPDLPGATAWVVLAIVVGGLVAYRPWRPALGAPLGFAWALLAAQLSQPPVVAIAESPVDLALDGRVVGLVGRRDAVARFVFAVDRASDGDRELVRPWRLRLSWRDAPPLRPGERLRLTARVKPAHGYASPGAWDYEGWLYRQGIRYTGYVRNGATALPAGAACCRIARWRAAIGTQIDGLPVSADARGVLRALTVGDKSGLSAALRQRFRDTGTSHLMAISGLHIGLAAGLGLVFVTAAWRRMPRLASRVPARVAGAVCGASAGLAYAVLAGFSLPTQRALIMLSVALLAILLRRDTRPAAVLATAWVCVLLYDPSAVVSAGLWLSFGAVAAILGALALLPKRPAWQIAVAVQLAISAVLWPILALWGMPVPGVSPLVNLLLVPLFALLIVPGSLLGVVALWIVPPLGRALLTVEAAAIDVLVGALGAAARFAEGWMLPSVVDWAGALALGIALLLLLAPRGFPLRWLGVPLIAAVVLPAGDTLAPGDFHVHVLDAGQGLSVVVETATHTLVYDTGPAYPSGFSTADAVVVPFLRTRGRRVVDRLVLSHGDNDHAGGAARLRATLPVRAVLAGEPGRTLADAQTCRRGQRWQWDDVEFRVLYPFAPGERRGNDASCVLRISNGVATVLLTGDIESAAERRLVAAAPTGLRSDVVVVPHHGSRTSSSQALVAAVAPRYAIYAAGWANRYGFPDDTVDARWRAIGARRLNTAQAGTISLAIDAHSGVGFPRCQRVHNRRFWWHDGGTADACHAVSSANRAASLAADGAPAM